MATEPFGRRSFDLLFLTKLLPVSELGQHGIVMGNQYRAIIQSINDRVTLILSFVGSKPTLMRNKILILNWSLFIVMHIRCQNWLLMNISARFRVASVFEGLLAVSLEIILSTQAGLILRTRLILLANGSVDATLNEVQKPRGSCHGS